jgi:hypothetical protein
MRPINRWYLILLASVLITAQAHADTFFFKNITGNNVANATAGESQLSVEVTAGPNGQVIFHFNNAGPAASSITDVYFDDGTLLGIATLVEGPGVNFTAGSANPGNLPGDNNVSPSFQVTEYFLADSDSPAQPNGVNPGEYLEIHFNLINGKTLAETIASLLSGELRIGIHVQGFADGGSESFINAPHPVPEPATMMLIGFGLVGLAAFGRKKLA